MPIVVGGTNYYIESIVYKILVEDMDDDGALLWDMSRRKRDFAKDNDEIEPKEKMRYMASSSDVFDETTKEARKSVDDLGDRRECKTFTESAQLQNEISGNNMDINVKYDIMTKENLKHDVNNEKDFTNEEIHAKLKSIDPIMASRLHPNNRRKVLR